MIDTLKENKSIKKEIKKKIDEATNNFKTNRYYRVLNSLTIQELFI